MDINNKMIAPKQKIFNLYCYRVAGAVGLLCLNIFGENNKNSRSFGIALANAFQITNILRDIKEDSLIGIVDCRIVSLLPLPGSFIINSVSIKVQSIVMNRKSKVT